MSSAILTPAPLNRFLADLHAPHECDVPLGPYTWYGVGGRAAVLARPSNVQQLGALVSKAAAAGLPLYVLGAGANLLVADEGVPGIVVKLDDPSFKQLSIKDNLLTVGAGYDLARLVLDTAKAGLSGLECLAGIPATIGGAVKMNAGGAYGDVGRSVRRIQVMDPTGQVYYRDRDDLIFSYRKTNITARFILEVELELTKSDPDEAMKEVRKVFAYKSSTQPLGAHSAGCAFKNPPPEVGASAGKLIDRAGLKGYRVGNAQVSTHHANFVVTHPGATAADVRAVIEHVQRTVAEQSAVQLEREVVTWP